MKIIFVLLMAVMMCGLGMGQTTYVPRADCPPLPDGTHGKDGKHCYAAIGNPGEKVCHVIGEHSTTCDFPEPLKVEPHVWDSPAIKHEIEVDADSNWCNTCDSNSCTTAYCLPKKVKVAAWECKDKKAFMLHNEGGELRCVRFPREATQ